MREKSLRDTYRIRDIKLKGVTYEEYLHSDRWKEIKTQLRKMGRHRKCRKCNSTEKLHFHHTTYKNLFTPDDHKDIIVFCEKCHNDIHNISKKENISVKRATLKFLSNHRKSKRKKIEEVQKVPYKVRMMDEISQSNNKRLVDGMNELKEKFAEIKRQRSAEKKRKK